MKRMHHHTQFLFCLCLFFLWYGVCVCVCEFVCMHSYACVWRPEVDTICLSQFCSTLFLRQGLTLNLEQGRLINKLQESSRPHCHQGWGYKHTLSSPAFIWVLEIWTWVPTLVQQGPQALSHLPSPQTLRVWTNSFYSNIKQIYKSLLFVHEVLAIV